MILLFLFGYLLSFSTFFCVTHPTLKKIKELQKQANALKEINLLRNETIQQFFQSPFESIMSIEDFCELIAEIIIDFKNTNEDIFDLKEYLKGLSPEDLYNIITDQSWVGEETAKLCLNLISCSNFVILYNARMSIERLVYAIILRENPFPYKNYKEMSLAKTLVNLMEYIDINKEKLYKLFGKTIIDDLYGFLNRFKLKGEKGEMGSIQYAKFLKEISTIKSRVPLFKDNGEDAVSLLEVPKLIKSLEQNFGNGK